MGLDKTRQLRIMRRAAEVNAIIRHGIWASYRPTLCQCPGAHRYSRDPDLAQRTGVPA
jgi:hypothetical protein